MEINNKSKFTQILNIILLVIMVFSVSVRAQDNDLWKPFKYFEGSWKGRETGSSGNGQGDRVYEFILQDVFFHHRNVSKFEPQEKNPNGELHEDWSIYSYDKNRESFIMNAFYVETFTIQYIIEISQEGKKIVMNSENVINAPKGFRVRVTLQIINKNEFLEIFELGPPGKDLKETLRNYWTRKGK